MAITGIKLRCGPEHWASMILTHSGTIAAGVMAKINDLVGVYWNGGDSGDKDAFVYQADKILVPKVDGSGLTIAQGAKVYFSAGDAAVTGTAGGNTLCGRCIEAAIAADTTVLIALAGNVAA